MEKITENAIEEHAIQLLGTQGYTYIHGPSIAPDSDTPERHSFEDVLLLDRLQSAPRKPETMPSNRSCGSTPRNS